MSGPRWMTLTVSLVGLVLFAIMYWQLASDPVQPVGAVYLFFGLPFVLGTAVSVLSMQKRTRIMLYWLTAVFMIFTGAVTIFSGVGIYNAIAVIFFLVAAWMENESGKPPIPAAGAPSRRTRARFRDNDANADTRRPRLTH